MLIEILFIIAVSAALGSFLNVCIYRIPAGISIAFPASHCPRCQTKLKVIDLIPLISWLSVRGHCRYCHSHIPSGYFWVEMTCTLSCLLLYGMYGISYHFVMAVILLCLCLTVSFISLKEEKIPDSINLLVFILGSIHITAITLDYLPVNMTDYFTGAFAGIFLTAIFLFIETPVANYSLFVSAMGLLLGLKLTLLALWLALLIGILLTPFFIMNYKKFIIERLPVIPVLSVGLMCSYLFGNQLLILILNL